MTAPCQRCTIYPSGRCQAPGTSWIYSRIGPDRIQVKPGGRSSFLLGDAHDKSVGLSTDAATNSRDARGWRLWRFAAWRGRVAPKLSAANTDHGGLVPTLTFERLFAFVVLGHGRRQLLWFAVTRNPTAEWLAQQILEAFPWDTAPAYLVRDNDAAYGRVLTRRLRAMGIRDRPITPRLGANEGRGAKSSASACRLFCLKATPMRKESYPQEIALS